VGFSRSEAELSDDFDLERDIPDELWALIETTGGDASILATELWALEREAIARLFNGFVGAKVEMAYCLSNSGRALDASEDTLDDLADSLIAAGKRVYDETYRGMCVLPDPVTWHELPGLTSTFVQVFTERFCTNIFDEIEELQDHGGGSS
jgi:hypothetical protein